jgi:hypothetical protein
VIDQNSGNPGRPRVSALFDIADACLEKPRLVDLNDPFIDDEIAESADPANYAFRHFLQIDEMVFAAARRVDKTPRFDAAAAGRIDPFPIQKPAIAPSRGEARPRKPAQSPKDFLSANFDERLGGL